MRRVEHAKTDEVTELARTIELARSGNREAAIALVRTNEGKRYMDALRRDLGSLLDVWRQKRKVVVRDAHERLAALTLVAIFICCMMVYTVVVQRRAFAKVQAWSAALDREATHDALTGLPNRRRLLTAVDALNAQTGPRGQRVGLLYLDIYGFKAVNDELGHTAGDALLRRLGESLRAATQQNDMLARVGGDEFVLLASDCGDDVKLCELAVRLISKVRVVAGHEYGGRFPIGVSIGIATWPDRVNTVEDLLDVADAAMYVAKRGRPVDLPLRCVAGTRPEQCREADKVAGRLRRLGQRMVGNGPAPSEAPGRPFKPHAPSAKRWKRQRLRWVHATRPAYILLEIFGASPVR